MWPSRQTHALSVVPSKMAGGDQDYLRHEQYRDAQRLTQRASLHVKYRGDAAELARVVHPDGAVMVSTNRRHHLRPLGRILAEVLGVPEVSDTVMAFGPEPAFVLLHDHFRDVRW